MQKVHLVFLKFNDNLFAANQPPRFSNSVLIGEKKIFDIVTTVKEDLRR